MTHSTFPARRTMYALLVLVALSPLFVGCDDEESNSGTDTMAADATPDVTTSPADMTAAPDATTADTGTTPDATSTPDVTSAPDVTSQADQVADAVSDGIALPDLVPDLVPDVVATDVSTGVDIPMVMNSCDEAGLSECFFNDECMANERCQNIGTGGFEVPCCVVGPRGTGVPGDVCSGELDCASGICVIDQGPDGICSQSCMDNNDCPAQAPVCTTIPFVGGLCLPS